MKRLLADSFYLVLISTRGGCEPQYEGGPGGLYITGCKEDVGVGSNCPVALIEYHERNVPEVVSSSEDVGFDCLWVWRISPGIQSSAFFSLFRVYAACEGCAGCEQELPEALLMLYGQGFAG
jgi:hypothetical protein